MEAIAQILIFGFIIWLNLALGKRKKLKRKKDLLDDGVEDSKMEEVRQRMREIKANAYWQQFRERIVPPEFILDDEDEELYEDVEVYEEKEEIKESPKKVVEEPLHVEEIPVEIIEKEKDPEETDYTFNLSKRELQRGIILAEILSPCLAKRKSGIRRI